MLKSMAPTSHPAARFNSPLMDGILGSCVRYTRTLKGKAAARSVVMGTVTQYPNRDDAVVQGIDTHWLSANGRWSWDTQFVGSKTDEATGYGLWTDIGWTPQQGMSHRLAVDLLDDDVDLSDLGYLRRNDSISFRYSFFYHRVSGPFAPSPASQPRYIY